MWIIKRDGSRQAYDPEKISRAIARSFDSAGTPIDPAALAGLVTLVEEKIRRMHEVQTQVGVEDIQDLVEQTLMEQNLYPQMKGYILYRENRARMRRSRMELAGEFPGIAGLLPVLDRIQRDFQDEAYDLELLARKYRSMSKPELSEQERLELLIRAAVERTTQEAPQWERIAARLLMLKFDLELARTMTSRGIGDFYDKLVYLTQEGLYGDYILAHYSPEEIRRYAAWIRPERNALLNYSGLSLLLDRYIIRTGKGVAMESPQEMFLGIAMHLAMKEIHHRDQWVQRFYDMLSQLQVTMATPTLSNARKPFHQLSSCFIDTVPDSLDGIYRSIDNFAKVSKFGGGMGMYFGKVRAAGSSIRGFEGAAGGVIRWIRLANDTAVAVDQLGVRQGAVAVYLDVWHRDLPEFLNLRTNNGDDRMKAHDVFPAVCYPDYFWEQARDNLEGDWYLMCPHEIQNVKGYALEDCWGEEWTQKYLDCVHDSRIRKRVIPIKDIIRLIIKSAVETGTPFTFNRDTVNRANPNRNRGMIYCSNLCTEIAQNMDQITQLEQSIQTIDGETVVVTVTKPGEFVVCNLASLSLGHIDPDNREELYSIVRSAVRALDNVIDLNFFPLPYAKINNHNYRPIGLGVSGYHHMLAKQGIPWESDAHLAFAEKVFADIHYAAICASCEIAKEKGSYPYFDGSLWQTGAYFEERGLTLSLIHISEPTRL